MSHLKAVERLRPFEKSLVKGYFNTTTAKYVPRDILRLCLLFCFILDEFSTVFPSNSKGISIDGLNNTTIKMKHNETVIVIGRNLIKPHSGQYHWKLKVSSISKTGDGIKMGWVNTQKQNKLRHSLSITPDTWNRKENTFNLYFDTDSMEICTMNGHYINSKQTEPANDSMDYYFAIEFRGSNACIELLEYDESNWYLMHNKGLHNDGVMDIGIAKCQYDESIKIKHYRNALQMKPFVEEWNDIYLLHLNGINEYDTGYDHAIKHKKGINGIADLAESFIDNREISKALTLLSLLNDEELNITESNLKYGYCLKQNGESLKGAQYMELHLNELEIQDEEGILNTLQHLGWAYYHGSDFVNGLRVFQRLTHEQIVQYNIEGAFAHCLEHCDAEKALEYYRLYEEKYPHNTWLYQRMAEVYQHRNDVDSLEKQKACLLKNIEFSKDGEGKCHAMWLYGEFLQDKEKEYREAQKSYFDALDVALNKDQRRGICCSISINYHLLEEWDGAIQYGLEALKLKPDAPTLISNVAEYYFHAKQYENSYHYFKMAMEYDPLSPLTNGYFAMVLFEWERYDEAMVYFEKYFEFQDKVCGEANNGMKSKCYKVFANIFYKKENYEMSIDQCVEAMNDNDFIKYKQKDEIYYLLSRNYTKLMDFKSALEYLEKAKQINPKRKIYQNQIKILTNTMDPQFDIKSSK